MRGTSLKVLFGAGFAGLVSLMAGAAFADEEKSVWRLFVADHTAPVVRAIDASDGKELAKFDIKGFAALSASGSGQSVFAVQGDANTVNVIKSGIRFEDHGEHSDLETSDPALLPFTIEGEKPGHVVSHGDDVVMFYDRGGKADLYSEHALLDGKTATKSFGTTAAHHGVAVTMGKYLLVSVPDMKAETKPGDLPPRLGLRILDEKGEQVGDVAPCTGLHGEAYSAKLVAFGCEEGVLIASPVSGKEPKLEMLAYGDKLPKGKVSTLLGGKAMQFFLGNYGEDKVALIDPEGDEPYRLVDLPTRRVDFALDPAHITNAYVLTEDGKLHLIDTLSGEIRLSETVTEPYSKDGHWRDPRPRLAVAGDEIAITDPRHSLVRMVNVNDLKETRTIPIEGQPFSIIAVGGSGAVH